MLDIKKLIAKILESLCTGWFYANSVTATTISTINTYTKLPITSIYAGVGFEYDSTNKGIKCMKTGKYMVSVEMSFDTATAGDLMGIAIYRNGVVSISPTYHRVGGNYDRLHLLPTYVDWQAGDVLTLYVRNNSSARGKSATSCKFSAWQVGG